MEEDVQIKPAFKEKNIPVVFNADNNYVNYVKVMLHSLIKNTTKENNYDLIFLNRDISEENQKSIINMAKKHENISIRFLDINPKIKNLNLKVRNIFTVEAFFRLFMPYILKEYDKAIYLDCDLVLCEDIANLYSIDIGNNLVGAVRDIGMILWYYKKEPPNKLKYIDTVLKDINIDEYFNSGVMILNLEEFRRAATEEQIITLIKSENWLYPGQDELNIFCKDRIRILPAEWNVIPEIPWSRSIIDICKYVPKEYAEEYIESRKKPSITHYALKEKPWKYTSKLDYELYKKFWNIASETDCFKKLILEFSKNSSISEAYSIYTKYFDRKDLKEVYGKSRVSYILDDIMFKDLSDIVVIYDNVEFESNIMNIEGKIEVPNFIDLNQFSIYLKVNDNMNKCESFEYPVETQYSDQVTDVCLRFKGKVDLNIADNISISICIKYKGIEINLNKIKCDGHFILNETYTKQYYYNKNRIFTINKDKICIEKANKFKVLKKEIIYLRYLKQRNTVWDKRAIILRTIYHILKMFKKKSIWLIGDNFLADDNGVALFKYLKSIKNKKCIPFLVISRRHKEFSKFRKIGNVISYKSNKHKIIRLLSDCIVTCISTDESIKNPFKEENYAYQDILSKSKFIYLKHGIITQDCTEVHNKYKYFANGFIVAAKPEYDSILSYNYYYKPEEVLLTGLARFDYLYNEPKKYITLMPTWRKALRFQDSNYKVVANFQESTFYKFYNELLHNKRLKEYLRKNGYKLCLCLHPLFKKTAPLFKKDDDDFIVFEEEKYRDVFAWSNLIISDYSSAIFDFLYLRKPIIYSQPDKEEFFASHVYTKGYLDYEKDGFGEVEYTIEGTVDRIIEYVENDCKLKDKYRERIDNFFAYNDKNNCKRIYEEIIKLEGRG